MGSRTRVTGIASCLLLSLVLPSATVPALPGLDHGSSIAAPLGPVVGAAAGAVPAPSASVPAGALATSVAMAELRRADDAPMVELDASGHGASLSAPPGGT